MSVVSILASEWQPTEVQSHATTPDSQIANYGGVIVGQSLEV